LLINAIIYVCRFVQEENAEESAGGAWRGYVLAVALFLVNVVQLLVLQQYWTRCYQAGMEMRAAAIGAIYDKSLKLSNDARRAYTLGQIVNLVTTDANTLQETLPSLNMAWSMPLQIVLALYFLSQELGLALISGVVILILLIPFNIQTGKKQSEYQSAKMKSKDRRIRIMYEILNSIKIIKYNAWEETFIDKVGTVRSEEVGYLRKLAVLKAFINFIFGTVPIMVTLVSFGTYVAIDPENNHLSADKMFVCIALFNLLRLPMHLLQIGINALVRYRVAVKRITKFLAAEELEECCPAVRRLHPGKERGDGDDREEIAVDVRNGTFAWGAEDEPALHGVELKIPRGSLVAVVGRVGAGKSSLLSAILGEMDARGCAAIDVRASSVAYVSQTPWIQNCTVKKNVLFGVDEEKVNDRWYAEVVSACALKDDFKLLSDGDRTMIGENGINLSGGQKQRVTIARAAYRGADLYLFDDPLSALDANTSNHVFDEVISNSGILGRSTRILATHRTNVLKKADFVVVLKDGRVVDFDAPNKLMAAGSELSLILKEEIEREEEEAKEEEEKQQEQKRKDKDSRGGEEKKDAKEKEVTAQEKAKAEKAKEAEKRIKDEGVLTGKVKMMAYSRFLQSVGWLSFIAILVLYVANQVVSTGSTIWLASWSDHNTEVTKEGGDNYNNGLYLGVLGAFGVGQGLFSFARNYVFYTAAANGANRIHASLFDVVIRGRMRFFDTTPTGSVVNRFSGDMQVVDNTLPQALNSFLFTFIEVFAVLIVISIRFPVFLAVIPILAVLYFFLIRIYLPASRQVRIGPRCGHELKMFSQVKRFEAVTKSPINLHFSESVQGAPLIRAFGEVKKTITHAMLYTISPLGSPLFRRVRPSVGDEHSLPVLRQHVSPMALAAQRTDGQSRRPHRRPTGCPPAQQRDRRMGGFDRQLRHERDGDLQLGPDQRIRH